MSAICGEGEREQVSDSGDRHEKRDGPVGARDRQRAVSSGATLVEQPTSASARPSGRPPAPRGRARSRRAAAAPKQPRGGQDAAREGAATEHRVDATHHAQATGSQRGTRSAAQLGEPRRDRWDRNGAIHRRVATSTCAHRSGTHRAAISTTLRAPSAPCEPCAA